MRLDCLWLQDFRSYKSLELPLADGLTALVGPNGVGKTNVVEAVSLLSTLKSFRRAPTDSLVRRGASTAVVRAEGQRDGRDVLIEIEVGGGSTRVQVNRQKLRRSRDLLGALRATIFAPDDLALIKEGPAVRRDYLDDLLVSLDPKADRLCSDVDRIIRQRNALLRSSRGSLDESATVTLDVWDAKLAVSGEALTASRQRLVGNLLAPINEAYEVLAGASTEITMSYIPSWEEPTLAEALAAARTNDVRRSVTSVGPHRDDVGITIDGFASRSEASQGEQRSVALALRLAGHQLITAQMGEPPLLLLDDVLSELDPDRCRRLLDHAVEGQTILTTASQLPAQTNPDQVVQLDGDFAGLKS